MHAAAFVAVIMIMVACMGVRAAGASTVAATATVRALAQPLDVLPTYGSVTLDWWQRPPYGTTADILDIDLNSPRLRTVAAALSPGLLRIGGSEDVVVKYLVGNATRAECEAPTVFRGANVSKCLTMARWDAVNTFARGAGLKLVFGP